MPLLLQKHSWDLKGLFTVQLAYFLLLTWSELFLTPLLKTTAVPVFSFWILEKLSLNDLQMAVSLLRTIPIIKQPIITCFSLKLSAKSRTNRVDCWLQVKKRDSKEEKNSNWGKQNHKNKFSFVNMENKSEHVTGSWIIVTKTKTSHLIFLFRLENKTISPSTSLFRYFLTKKK